MSELRELYQQLIIDHARSPRNFKKLDTANHIKEGFNPLCGDKLTLYLYERDGLIHEVGFTGSGCAISMASTSLMTEILQGKTWEEAEQIFENFHDLVTKGNCDDKAVEIGKLVALSGVYEFPSRVKCATLSWHAMMALLNNEKGVVTTE